MDKHEQDVQLWRMLTRLALCFAAVIAFALWGLSLP